MKKSAVKKHNLKVILCILVMIFLTGCAKDSRDDSLTNISDVTDSGNEADSGGKKQEDKEQDVTMGEYFYDVQKDEAEKGMTAMSEPVSDSPFLMPILQNPTESTVIVQWFTEGNTSDNRVLLYENPEALLTGAKPEPSRVINATSQKMSRLLGGKTDATKNDSKIDADIYKHVAVVDGLQEYHGDVSERVVYSISSDGRESDIYTLAAAPQKGTPLQILLTSDQQLKPMCAANYQKVYETLGHVDAILCGGDMADVSDRAYDWFYAPNAFWKLLTGTADYELNGVRYYGAPLVQYAPIFTTIGNHDVMGQRKYDSLYEQFCYPVPSEFYTTTYEEMFELPESKTGGERYYIKQFGDLSFISLEVARVWRLPAVGLLGKYSELPGAKQTDYGYGDFIFESVKEDSVQIEFLKQSLESAEYKNAKYKTVMFHSEGHSLGDNAIPAFTDPKAQTVTDPVTGQPMVLYTYPKTKDYINTVIEPLIEKAETDLLFNAHSHMWSRFNTASGMNVLETSLVGNTYGTYYSDSEKTRDNAPDVFSDSSARSALRNYFDADDYLKKGDLFGLIPVASEDTKNLLDNESLTVFSILDTRNGCVNSYGFDTSLKEKNIILFDTFSLE